jgi:hypothetical protein
LGSLKHQPQTSISLARLNGLDKIVFSQDGATRRSCLES